MAALEARYCGHALVVMVEGARPPVSPPALLAELEEQCGVMRARVHVEVTYPVDFFVLFESEEDCEHVIQQSLHFCCCGTWMSLCRCSRYYGAVKVELPYYSKVNAEGLLASAWEIELVFELMAALKGKLISIEPRRGCWCITFYSWPKDPCVVRRG
jgi:hypothetical protein